MSLPKLFSPIRLGSITLQHRVVLAPLTRCRANAKHVHGDLAVEYYKQRAATLGTLLITEATFIAPQASGLPHVPGVYNEEQIAAWKRVADAVHAKGSYIYMQLWALGRAANPQFLEQEGGYPYVSASDVQLSTAPCPPRPLTVEEIKEYVELYATAASNAIHGADFDGVEIHAANGYLIDQFTQDVSNKRTDLYGGSMENRCRFALEVVGAIAKKVGEEKTGIRFSPWGTYQDMRMEDPVPTFSYLVKQLVERHPSLAYVHLVEPRVSGINDLEVIPEGDSSDHFRKIWQPRPLITSGGYDRKLALEVAEETGDLIAFGRHYIPNPDLPYRLMKNLPLQKSDRATYYTFESPVGYTDWPAASESAAPAKVTAKRVAGITQRASL